MNQSNQQYTDKYTRNTLSSEPFKLWKNFKEDICENMRNRAAISKNCIILYPFGIKALKIWMN